MHLKSGFRNPAAPLALRAPAVLLCLFLSTAAPLLGQEHYLVPGQPDGIALLPPPPAAGSVEEAADLASARAVFKGRTPAQEKRAMTDASLSFSLFAPAIGPAFAPATLPKTQALLEKVKIEISNAIDTPKDHFKRLRPYQLDEHLSLGQPEPSFGYPSGHSTRGTVYSLVLAELFPEKKQAILALGRDIGWDRVLIGKHFPSDVYAGRVLGQAIVRELLAGPAFQHDLSEAKLEIHLGQHAPVPAAVEK
ncbi:MAG TPA: phosphatase PAP2 family protein [Candidatus Binatia bacterium]|nr:phosphatase PAP2 family protein [Candidatus Binatia bacterium]